MSKILPLAEAKKKMHLKDPDVRHSCVKQFGSLRLGLCDVVDHAPLCTEFICDIPTV